MCLIQSDSRADCACLSKTKDPCRVWSDWLHSLQWMWWLIMLFKTSILVLKEIHESFSKYKLRFVTSDDGKRMATSLAKFKFSMNINLLFISGSLLNMLIYLMLTPQWRNTNCFTVSYVQSAVLSVLCVFIRSITLLVDSEAKNLCQLKSPAAPSRPDTGLFIHNGLLKGTVGRWSVGNGTPVPSDYTALTFWPPFCSPLQHNRPLPHVLFGCCETVKTETKNHWTWSGCNSEYTYIKDGFHFNPCSTRWSWFSRNSFKMNFELAPLCLDKLIQVQ